MLLKNFFNFVDNYATIYNSLEKFPFQRMKLNKQDILIERGKWFKYIISNDKWFKISIYYTLMLYKVKICVFH